MKIIFNEDWLTKVLWTEVMVTCFHECRHAYQAYSVKHNLNESKEILNKWNNDFNTYNMPSGTLDEKADINYLTQPDRKSTRLNSSHVRISYAVFCLKKKINEQT